LMAGGSLFAVGVVGVVVVVVESDMSVVQ
jgi:hypothetical protein